MGSTTGNNHFVTWAPPADATKYFFQRQTGKKSRAKKSQCKRYSNVSLSTHISIILLQKRVAIEYLDGDDLYIRRFITKNTQKPQNLEP